MASILAPLLADTKKCLALCYLANISAYLLLTSLIFYKSDLLPAIVMMILLEVFYSNSLTHFFTRSKDYRETI